MHISTHTPKTSSPEVVRLQAEGLEVRGRNRAILDLHLRSSGVFEKLEKGCTNAFCFPLLVLIEMIFISKDFTNEESSRP